MKIPLMAGIAGAVVVVLAGAAAAGSSRAADQIEPSVPPETVVTEPGTNGAPLERPELVDPPPESEPVDFPVNAKGETYGSAINAMSPDEEPELIAAVATNGKSGYVRKSELDAADPAPISPEAAATAKPVRETVPVYASDGSTVIGEFKVGV